MKKSLRTRISVGIVPFFCGHGICRLVLFSLLELFSMCKRKLYIIISYIHSQTILSINEKPKKKKKEKKIKRQTASTLRV